MNDPQDQPPRRFTLIDLGDPVRHYVKNHPAWKIFSQIIQALLVLAVLRVIFGQWPW